MRISDKDKKGIITSLISSAKSLKIELIQIILFGSRVDDDKLGGDIDLLIEIDDPLKTNTSPEEIIKKFKLDLELNVEEQKIDLVIDWPGNNNNNFINLIRSKKTEVLWKR
ncbi:MAG: nucleotidyltransferase domain-containing protein [Oligoflexia bacterium]|nr:nucleotidyltransferase domain-containing protein [Oligoflexia bacterium]